MANVRYKYESEWTYKTSTSGGGAFWFVAGEKGTITLISPAGQAIPFDYFAAGGAAGVSLKIPNVGKLEVLGGGKWGLGKQTKGYGFNYASEDYFSAGRVLVLESFKGDDLGPRDFTGFCLLMELSVAMTLGATASVLITGLSPRDMQHGLLEEFLIDTSMHPLAVDMLNRFGITDKLGITGASALIQMFGVNKGAQGSAGGTAMLGYLSLGSPPDEELLTRFELRQESEPIIDIRRTTADKGFVLVSGDALFASGKYFIRPEAGHVLTRVASYLRSQSALRIVVNGHTDSIGSAGFNTDLAKYRAKTVAEWLERHMAPTTASIAWQGWGEESPIASNRTVAGRRRNRRVSIAYERYKIARGAD